MPAASAVLSFEEARGVISDRMRALSGPRSSQRLPLAQCRGRVLAEKVAADRDYPPFNRSTRDGYAVIAEDVAQPPARLRVIGETRAGEPSRFHLRPGQAVRIMTGAPGPAGADAIVMQEYSRAEGDEVVLESGVASGKNLIFQGSEIRQGQTVLEEGAVLDYSAIALLASVGKSEVAVYRKPSVSILATGDEVVELSALPERYQIRNSNAFSLAAQVVRQGAEPSILPIAPDRLDRTRELVEQGLEADLLVLSGGVSVGSYDFVGQVLAELGAEIYFTKVAIQPGKPLIFGHVNGTPVFGLPGNPISTIVTFEIFARIGVHVLAGRRTSPLPFTQARLAGDFKHKPVVTRFLPAVLTGDYGEARVHPVKWQGSGDLVALARANCFLVATPDRDRWEAGDWISVLPK